MALSVAAGLAWRQFGHDAPLVETTPTEASTAVTPHADFGTTDASADAHALADRVVAAQDHGDRPFAIIDKVAATLFVFDAAGRLTGSSPILLGLAPGDDSVPGIGDRPIAAIRPEERTTPAGRFVAKPGLNTGGESVVWVDYDAAVSMHSVRALVASERRLERLASPDPKEHRISYGCVNVPDAFFKTVAQPAFSTAGGVIYVLPETRPWQTVFEPHRD